MPYLCGIQHFKKWLCDNPVTIKEKRAIIYPGNRNYTSAAGGIFYVSLNTPIGRVMQELSEKERH